MVARNSVENAVDSVRTIDEPGAFQTIAEALLASPQQQRFITDWKADDDIRSVTFGEFLGRARWHAVELHARGLRTGDRVILILPQGIGLMAAFAGALLLC